MHWSHILHLPAPRVFR